MNACGVGLPLSIRWHKRALLATLIADVKRSAA
jgi:hypothetical protein